jgi:hypothetical protein
MQQRRGAARGSNRIDWVQGQSGQLSQTEGLQAVAGLLRASCLGNLASSVEEGMEQKHTRGPDRRGATTQLFPGVVGGRQKQKLRGRKQRRKRLVQVGRWGQVGDDAGTDETALPTLLLGLELGTSYPYPPRRGGQRHPAGRRRAASLTSYQPGTSFKVGFGGPRKKVYAERPGKADWPAASTPRQRTDIKSGR